MPASRFSVRRDHLAKLHVFLHVALGAAVLISALANWHGTDPLRFGSFLVAAALGSALNVRLPGLTGTTPVSSLFVLAALVNLSLSQALVVGTVSMLVQCTWRTQKRPALIQIALSVSALAIAIYITAGIYAFTRSRFPEPIALAIVAFTYFCANTFPLAAIVGLTEGKRILSLWTGDRWTLAYYAVGASMGWVIGTLPRANQWEFPVICLPLVYLMHRSNRAHLAQMEQDSSHMQAMNGLHLRTIEALALAIDAKDHTTHDHLQRVQLYAIQIGKDLGLSEHELEALTAAAVLHDIGKLAVPESIISKPGKLTRSEFDKMKIHPVVGAEILERVEFPYPVAPIVRAHHEKWDGTGYPYGLRGEDIPIGARILSVVDCLDALASDRQYRRALPLDEAMARIASESGTTFDPRVVGVLQARYRELEARAKITAAPAQPSLSVDIRIPRGSAPAAGFQTEAADQHRAHQKPLEIPTAGLCSLEWDEALAVACLRIGHVISHDAIAFFACEEDFVRARFAAGQDRTLLEALNVRLGEGLVGWVAELGKPILNGNPAVEPGYGNSGVSSQVESNQSPALKSALALPLLSAAQVVGVVALYRTERDAFATEELASLAALCPALAALILETSPIETSQKDGNLQALASALGPNLHPLPVCYNITTGDEKRNRV